MRLLRKLRLLVMTKVARHCERSEESQNDVSKLVSKEGSKNVIATDDFTSPLAGEVCFQVEHERNLENRVRGKINKLDCIAFARNDRNLLLNLLTNLLTCKRYAFTLAEVLITLGIIGVVAALTMPSLIQNHQKKVFAFRVKTTYSILSNALVYSVAENGSVKDWDYGLSRPAGTPGDPSHIEFMINKYFLPYLKTIENGRNFVRLTNGTTLYFSTDGNTKDDVYTPNMLYIVASFEGNKKAYSDMSRDYSRKNIMMRVAPGLKDKIMFFNWDKSNTREGIINEPKYGCRKEVEPRNRYGCGALIQYDGWEIKDDYPW